MENPKNISNAYLEDDLRRIFRCNLITLREAVDGITHYFNEKLQHKIKLNRLVEDLEYQSSGVEFEIEDDVVDQEYHDLISGPNDQ